MKVLFLTNTSTLMDGINRHVLTISRGLVKEGVDVSVCTVESKGDPGRAVEGFGVKYYSLNCSHGHSLKILPRFAAVIREVKPDVVHIHELALMERIVLSCMFKTIPIVRTKHGIAGVKPSHGFKSRVIKILNRIFPIRLSAVCYVSKGVQETMRSYFDSPIHECVYNPVDVNARFDKRALARELRLPEGTPIIGTACRIARIKNPAAFTEVMKRVVERIDSAHAVIIGAGDAALEERMEEIASGHERIHFLGKRSDARQLMAGCTAIVMTSDSEGLPTALLEAMASDVPIVFWVGGGGLKDIAELNENEGPIGAVSDPGDIDGLVEGLAKILRREIVIPKGQISDIAKKYFSVESAVCKLKAIYGRVANAADFG